MNDNKQNKNEQEQSSWSTARKYAELYGNIPSSFSTLIRGLLKDAAAKTGKFSDTTRWQLLRLLRSESVHCALYFAAKTFRSEEMAKVNSLQPQQLAALFEPMDLAATLGMLYLFRRAQKLADPKEWELLTAGLETRSELGGLIGFAIPSIGFSVGLVSGTMRQLGMVSFLIHDAKGLAEYRRQLKINRQQSDLAYEIKRWGCTHAQIISNLLITLGFSTLFSESIGKGFALEQLEEPRECPSAYAVKCTETWIEALSVKSAPPDIVHRGKYYPEKAQLTRLLSESATTRERGSRCHWLLRKAEEFTPENAPECFTAAGKTTEQTQAPADEDKELLQALDDGTEPEK